MDTIPLPPGHLRWQQLVDCSVVSHVSILKQLHRLWNQSSCGDNFAQDQGLCLQHWVHDHGSILEKCFGIEFAKLFFYLPSKNRFKQTSQMSKVMFPSGSIFQSSLTKPNNDVNMCTVICSHASCIPFTQWSSRLLSAEIIFGPLRLLQVRTVCNFLEADGDHWDPSEPSKSPGMRPKSSKTFRNHSQTGRADFSPPAKQLQANWTPVTALALAATATAAGLPERATLTHKQFFSNVQSQ